MSKEGHAENGRIFFKRKNKKTKTPMGAITGHRQMTMKWLCRCSSTRELVQRAWTPYSMYDAAATEM